LRDDTGGVSQVVRQRFARALVSHPEIVLADKPTVALNKTSGRDVVESLAI